MRVIICNMLQASLSRLSLRCSSRVSARVGLAESCRISRSVAGVTQCSSSLICPLIFLWSEKLEPVFFSHVQCGKDSLCLFGNLEVVWESCISFIFCYMKLVSRDWRHHEEAWGRNVFLTLWGKLVLTRRALFLVPRAKQNMDGGVECNGRASYQHAGNS